MFKRKEKFVYNKSTLTYEKVVVTLKQQLLRLFSFFSVAVVSSVIFLSVAFRYFPSPREAQLKRQMEQMEYKYAGLNDELKNMSKVLDNIQQRDAGVHRMMFGMEPIDKAVWNGGVGGHNRFEDFFNFGGSSKIIESTLSKADLLQRQLVLQSKSLDTIQQLAKEKEKMFASIPSIKPVREDKLNRSISLMSGFGMRIHPIHKVSKMHAGIDFAAPKGTAIQATGDGRVVKVDYNSRGYGSYVEIDHGYGYVTLYGHMSRVDVHLGQKISKGHRIGLIGSTGTSTAPHCHYEVHYRGTPVNPIQFCLDGLSPKQYQEMVNASAASNQSFD